MRTFLSELRKNSIHIKLEGGELSVKFPKGKVIDKALLEEIKAKKENLINYLSALNNYNFSEISVVKEQENYPLSSSQRRLWVLSQFEEGNVAYNMPGVY